MSVKSFNITFPKESIKFVNKGDIMLTHGSRVEVIKINKRRWWNNLTEKYLGIPYALDNTIKVKPCK